MKWELCQRFGKVIENLGEEWPLWQEKILTLAKAEQKPMFNKIMKGLEREATNAEGMSIRVETHSIHPR